MYYVLVGVLCFIAGAVSAVVYYRRHVRAVESALADAKAERQRFQELLVDYQGRGKT